MNETEIVVEASNDRDLTKTGRAKKALEYAVTEKGIIMRTGDGYVPS